MEQRKSFHFQASSSSSLGFSGSISTVITFESRSRNIICLTSSQSIQSDGCCSPYKALLYPTSLLNLHQT